LDKESIICCNINSTNLKPYEQFLEALGVPFVVITDGDYYYHNEKKEKIFGSMWQDSHENFGYDGYDRIKKILIDLVYLNNEEIPDDSIKQKKIFSDYGYYVGVYTLEIDMMS
ncbi:ATP-dependent endonuclease, partial [Enterobacter mori]